MKIAYLSIPLALVLLVSMMANVFAAADFVQGANKPYYVGPKLDRLIIRYVTDNAVQWELFKTKEVNFVRAESIPETQLIDFANENPDDVLLARVAPPPWGAGVFFELEKWPTSELPVRKALAHLFDWDYATTQIFKPGIRGEIFGWMPGQYLEWQNPNPTTYVYSIQAAKDELTNAGWTQDASNNWFSPNGTAMGPVIYITPGYSPERMQLQLAMSQAASQMGIQIDIQHPPEWPTIEQVTYVEKNYNIFVNNHDFDQANPASVYFATFHSDSYTPIGASSNNYISCRDPVLDGYINTLRTTLSKEEAIQACWNIEERIQTQCYVLSSAQSAGMLHAIWKSDWADYIGFKDYTLGQGPNVNIDAAGFVFTKINIHPANAAFGGTLSLVSNNFFTNMNPLNWKEAHIEEQFIGTQIYEQLLKFDDIEDTIVYGQGLATDYKMEPYDLGDGKLGTKYTFHLAQNVTWHDGVPFTAEDVKYTFDLISAMKVPSTYCANVWPVYVKSEIIDDYTVAIYTNSQSYFQLLDIAAGQFAPIILPKHIFELLPDKTAFENNPPIGTGPFMFESMTMNEFISFKANPNYHRSARTLTMQFTQEDTAKIIGEEATYKFNLVGPQGETVTNGTATVSLMKAGTPIYSTTATNNGGGTYQVVLDTGNFGEGDSQVKITAEYVTDLFTYTATSTKSLTVLPVIYQTLLQQNSELTQSVNNMTSTISQQTATINDLQNSVSSLTNTVNILMIVAAAAVVIAVVAIVYAVIKKPSKSAS